MAPNLVLLPTLDQGYQKTCIANAPIQIFTDILELNDAEEMAKRSAILIGLICFGFMGAASWMLF